MSVGQSVTLWIDALKGGSEGAAGQLWQRYFDRLVRLARRRMSGAAQRSADEEDVALSAFHSLCEGAARGRFGQLHDRDDLWRLLVVITARKAADRAQYERRGKRSVHRTVTESGLVSSRDIASGAAGLDGLASREPTPEFALLLAEASEHRLNQLHSPILRQVALWRLEGYSTDEIAEKLGCTRRTVTRKLALIRAVWLSD